MLKIKPLKRPKGFDIKIKEKECFLIPIGQGFKEESGIIILLLAAKYVIEWEPFISREHGQFTLGKSILLAGRQNSSRSWFINLHSGGIKFSHCVQSGGVKFSHFKQSGGAILQNSHFPFWRRNEGTFKSRFQNQA